MYAIDLTNASTMALIFGSLPILTALFAYALGVERLHRRFWIAAALSFGGVALVAAGSGGGFSGNFTGDSLALVGAATWGAYSVAIVPLLRRYSVWRIPGRPVSRDARHQPAAVSRSPVCGGAFLSEELTWLQIAGGVAIGIALLLARRRPALESA